jgi:hypothetical protein
MTYDLYKYVRVGCAQLKLESEVHRAFELECLNLFVLFKIRGKDRS